jgi:hypothetical protein
MDILGPNGVITKTTPDQLAKLWPSRQEMDQAARRADTVRGFIRVVEASLFLAALFVLGRFILAFLSKLS